MVWLFALAAAERGLRCGASVADRILHGQRPAAPGTGTLSVSGSGVSVDGAAPSPARASPPPSESISSGAAPPPTTTDRSGSTLRFGVAGLRS